MLPGTLVRLRAIVPDDHDALFELERDLATWELRGPRPPVPLDRATWDARLPGRLRGEDGGIRFAIEADGELVGSCMLMDVDPLARHAEVGVNVVAGARGRGYGTDALRVLARFAFRRHNLRRLHLVVLAGNAAGRASYRKVGFVEEGRRREHAWVDGAYEDEVLMGLLREELVLG